MPRVLIVFIGGGAGASMRAVLLAGLSSWGTTTPVLLVNLLGSCVLGFVYVLADEAGLLRSPARLFLAIGVLGGFTTFSTFGWGADLLITQGQTARAAVYLAASIGGGMISVLAGLLIGRGMVGLVKPGALVGRRVREAWADMDSIEAEDRMESG